jgi:hypothetical protein
MSAPDSLSLSEASTGNPSDRSGKTNHSNDRYRKPRIHRIVGVALAFAGAAILAFSLQFFLFHPMTATDEYIGRRMWIVGSWLLGGGVTLTIARPWVAALVGFFSPTLTFGMAVLLYFVLLLLAPILS